MRIKEITIYGQGANAYDKDQWTLTVYWDGIEIYTEDELGDYDTIGCADSLTEAKEFVEEYERGYRND